MEIVGYFTGFILLIVLFPYVFQQQSQRSYWSSLFFSPVVLYGIVGVGVLIFQTEKWLFLPWLAILLLLSVVDIYLKSVRVIDLIVLFFCALLTTVFDTLVVELMMVGIVGLVLLIVKGALKKVYGQNAFGAADICVILTILYVLGGESAIVAIYVSLFLSALCGFFMIVFFKKSKKTQLPFIPFLTIGVLVSVFFSEELIFWYYRAAVVS